MEEENNIEPTEVIGWIAIAVPVIIAVGLGVHCIRQNGEIKELLRKEVRLAHQLRAATEDALHYRQQFRSLFKAAKEGATFAYDATNKILTTVK